MKHRSSITLTIGGIVIAACGDQASLTRPMDARTHGAAASGYGIATLPSLGGTLSRGMGISNSGAVAGWSDTTGGTRRAAYWRGDGVIGLGTLGGPNSTVQWPGVNNQGMVVGLSQTAEPDSLDESFSCEAGGFLAVTGLVCRGFAWENGVMKALPTLGGTHSFATGVNDRGQVVGWAQTPVRDPTCTGTTILQFHAVVWEPKTGDLTTLRPLPGDSASAATAINQRGQVVGISGECDQAVGRYSARHAVLWEHGEPIEIGNLGGTSWHTPMAINERGEVVGFSNPPSAADAAGEFNAVAFRWSRRGGIDNLGTLPGDANSQAMGINARGQIVGVSFGGSRGSRAFIWEDGVMTDLNDLVDTDDVLLSAQHVNDAGQITGRLRSSTTGETLAFVATPRPR
jgi:probable HAF family extracellular repeat protein